MSCTQLVCPFNPELFQDLGQVVQDGHSLIFDGLQASSRPKRSNGWESQDRAAISLFHGAVNEQLLQTAYAEAALATESEEGGCSSTTVVLTRDDVRVAWLGDSPAFLIGIHPETGVIKEIKGLNEPHIPTYDRTDILNKGGRIDADGRLDLSASAADQVNNYSLSMSRSFGNRWLSGLLSRVPSIVHWPLHAMDFSLNWFAVLGSDGILPESERNLMFPAAGEAKPQDNDIIHRCADQFKAMANVLCPPSTSISKWASVVTQKAQEKLAEMEASADKKQVGYAAIDDTTFMLCPIGAIKPGISVVLTVTDGHRLGGEVTAQKAVDAIHASLRRAI
jgi:serine/threonine protein phosphatase PrpC